MTKLAMTNIEMLSEDERLLSVIPYDLRHAFQGDREVYKESLTFGFKTNWITLLYTIACLRFHQNYIPLNKIDMANLLILESSDRRSYATIWSARLCRTPHVHWIKNNVGDKYTYLAYREAANDFFSMPVGKKRFRYIPKLLIKWGIGSPTYNNFCKEIDRYIAENKCEIDQIDSQIAGDDHIIWWYYFQCVCVSTFAPVPCGTNRTRHSGDDRWHWCGNPPIARRLPVAKGINPASRNSSRRSLRPRAVCAWREIAARWPPTPPRSPRGGLVCAAHRRAASDSCFSFHSLQNQ